MEITEQSAWIEALTISKANFWAGRYGILFSWEDVPVHWLRWANEKNLLKWNEGEAAALRSEAQELANGDEARARVIRCKLAVWRKLVKPAK